MSLTASHAIGLVFPKIFLNFMASVHISSSNFHYFWVHLSFSSCGYALLSFLFCISPNMQQSYFPLLLQNASQLRELHKVNIHLNFCGGEQRERGNKRGSIIAQQGLKRTSYFKVALPEYEGTYLSLTSFFNFPVLQPYYYPSPPRISFHSFFFILC